MKRFYAICFMVSGSVSIMAQNGELQGSVSDAITNNGIGYANVALFFNGVLSGGATTDGNGNYIIKPIVPGTYDVKVSFLGYKSGGQIDVIIPAEQITRLNLRLTPDSIFSIGTIDVYSSSLIEEGEPEGLILDGAAVGNLPVASGNLINIIALTPGMIQQDDNAPASSFGSRLIDNAIYVDGVKYTGSSRLPKYAIGSISTQSGGLSARYGDALGVVTNITTKGASREFGGRIELTGSQFLDPAKYKVVNFALTGPLIKKSSGNDSGDVIAGFFITGEYEGNRDGDIPATGIYHLKEDVLAAFQAHPLTNAPTGHSFVPKTNFLSEEDISFSKFKLNSADHNFRMAGKFDFHVSDKVRIMAGGNLDISNYSGYDYQKQFADWENQLSNRDRTYRGYVRFTQLFKNDTSRRMQNMYYSFQADYTKFFRRFEDPMNQFNTFEYGYVGEFNRYYHPVFISGIDTMTGYTGFVQSGYSEYLVTYHSSDINKVLSNYTNDYFALAGKDTADYYTALSQVQSNGGLLNGDMPGSIYSLYRGVGTQNNIYGYRNNDQYRITFNGSFDIVNPKNIQGRHAIELGIECEQRINRLYEVFPAGLWGLMRQLVNRHNSSLDLSNPILVIDGIEYAYNASHPAFGDFDSIIYNRLVIPEQQTHFDKALREKLIAMGHNISDQSFLNVDAYGPETYSLDMFTPDELFNNGSFYTFEYGYDYLGNRLKKQPSFNDFFTKTDENGDYTRLIPSFRPIYAAAYIQDKFNFRDLVFNVGLRVDRFDANQKVMKDPYSLYEVHTAGETGGVLNSENGGVHPNSIGGNYVVYVDDPVDPKKILGYRNGDTWYNATGNIVNDPRVLLPGTGKIAPYLKATDLTSLRVTSDAFAEYTPQITFMPRISFAFPISHEANFFAHYDVLTQRPSGGGTLTGSALNATPFEFYYLQALQTDYTIPNAALKPEKTINYEVGFKQMVGPKSAITISGIYREMKDMVQVRKIIFAYPVDYTTYGNIDFGTVKSLVISYQLNRTKNMILAMSYLLQFADGTGSDATSQLGLVGSAQQLRTIIPFSYDQRHTITSSFDYRFSNDNKYKGPGGILEKVLKGSGLSMIFRAGSGTPFSRKSEPTPDAMFGVASRTTLAGQINGSRLPWSFKIDSKIDKDFFIKTSQGSSEKKEKGFYLNMYLLVQNVLNAKNVMSVYSFTGSPEDDGYLASSLGTSTISGQIDPSTFAMLYNYKLKNPDNYSLPRRIHMGLSVDF